MLGVEMSGGNFDGPYLFSKPTYEKPQRRHLFLVFDGLSNKTAFGRLARQRVKIEKMKFLIFYVVRKWTNVHWTHVHCRKWDVSKRVNQCGIKGAI